MDERVKFIARLLDGEAMSRLLFDREGDVKPCLRRAPPPDQGCFRSRPC